jgi:hypothetical protein
MLSFSLATSSRTPQTSNLVVSTRQACWSRARTGQEVISALAGPRPSYLQLPGLVRRAGRVNDSSNPPGQLHAASTPEAAACYSFTHPGGQSPPPPTPRAASKRRVWCRLAEFQVFGQLALLTSRCRARPAPGLALVNKSLRERVASPHQPILLVLFCFDIVMPFAFFLPFPSLSLLCLLPQPPLRHTHPGKTLLVLLALVSPYKCMCYFPLPPIHGVRDYGIPYGVLRQELERHPDALRRSTSKD